MMNKKIRFFRMMTSWSVNPTICIQLGVFSCLLNSNTNHGTCLLLLFGLEMKSTIFVAANRRKFFILQWLLSWILSNIILGWIKMNIQHKSWFLWDIMVMAKELKLFLMSNDLGLQWGSRLFLNRTFAPPVFLYFHLARQVKKID